MKTYAIHVTGVLFHEKYMKLSRTLFVVIIIGRVFSQLNVFPLKLIGRH